MNAVEAAVRDALSRVKDPEIPVCSIADLGLVERVAVSEDRVGVTLLPTFVGCPALDMILANARRAVSDAAPGFDVDVTYTFEPPWTTDRITPEGREALRAFGIAPPGRTMLQIAVKCPYCGSLETTIESEFGPTPCRTIRYCATCRNPFEGFKPKLSEV